MWNGEGEGGTRKHLVCIGPGVKLRGRNMLGLLTKAEQAEEGMLSSNHLCAGGIN